MGQPDWPTTLSLNLVKNFDLKDSEFILKQTKFREEDGYPMHLLVMRFSCDVTKR